jgi:fatty-acyl-CoA synthase
MAAVVGVPDEYWGEAVAAALVVDPTIKITTEAIIAHVKALKGSIHAPKHVQFLSELPVTALGKIDKITLRKGFTLSTAR